jgi:hypothetical protein
MSFNIGTVINQLLIQLRNKTTTKEIEFIPYTLAPPLETTNKLYSVNGLLYWGDFLLASPEQSTTQSVNFQPPDENGNVDLKIFPDGLTSLSVIYATDINTSSNLSGVSSLNSSLINLNNQINTKASLTSVSNLQAQVNTNITAISVLNTQVSNLQNDKLNISSVSQLLTGNLTINGQITGLSNLNIQDIQTSQYSINSTITNINTNLSVLNNQVANNTTAISNLENGTISSFSVINNRIQNILTGTSNLTICEDDWIYLNSSNLTTISILPNASEKLLINGGIETDYNKYQNNYQLKNANNITTFNINQTGDITTNSILSTSLNTTNLNTTNLTSNSILSNSLNTNSLNVSGLSTLNNVISNNLTSSSILTTNLSSTNISSNSILSNSLTVSDLTIFNGDVYFYGGSITSQSVISQFTSMSIIMNPGGNDPALSIEQTGGTNAILRITDKDTNIKFEINQDCDINLNNNFTVDSQTGNINTSGDIDALGDVDVAGSLVSNTLNIGGNNLVVDTSFNSNVNSFIGPNDGLTITEPDVIIQARTLPSYTGNSFIINSLADLQNAIANANNGDILSINNNIDVSSLGTAGLTINKGVEIKGSNINQTITSSVLNGTIFNITSDNVTIHTLTFNSLGQASNEVCLNFSGGAGVVNAYVNNCRFFADEFAITFNADRWQCTNCFFQYARGVGINESQRFINITRGLNSNCIIDSCEFSCFSGGDVSSQQLINISGGNNVINCNIVVSNCFTTAGSVCQRLMMVESGNINSNGNTFYIYNNTIRGSSGFIIWFFNVFLGNNKFYLVDNTHTVPAVATGSKGLVGGDFTNNTGTIGSLENQVFARNNTIDLPLRADYTQLSVSGDILAYATARFPNAVPNSVETFILDTVNINALLNINQNIVASNNLTTNSLNVSNLSTLNDVLSDSITSNSILTNSLSVSGLSTLNNVLSNSLTSNSILTNNFTLSNINYTQLNVLSDLNVNGSLINMSGNTILNISSGSGITLTPNNTTKSLLISGTATQNTFTNIGGIIANSPNTIMAINGGTGINVSADNLNKILTITNTGTGFNPTFTNLTLGDNLFYDGTIWKNGYYTRAPVITVNNQTITSNNLISPYTWNNSSSIQMRIFVYTDIGRTTQVPLSPFLINSGTKTFTTGPGLELPNFDTTYYLSTQVGFNSAVFFNTFSNFTNSTIVSAPQDALRAQLTGTSLSAYDNAPVNTWVQISEFEYSQLLFNVSGASQYGSANNYDPNAGLTFDTANTSKSVSGQTTYTNPQYPIALRYFSAGNFSGLMYFTFSSSSNVRGEQFITHSATGQNLGSQYFYVRKRPTTQVGVSGSNWLQTTTLGTQSTIGFTNATGVHSTGNGGNPPPSALTLGSFGDNTGGAFIFIMTPTQSWSINQ